MYVRKVVWLGLRPIQAVLDDEDHLVYKGPSGRDSLDSLERLCVTYYLIAQRVQLQTGQRATC